MLDEKYLTSLETSKRLRDAGVEQNSGIYWYRFIHPNKHKRLEDNTKWQLISCYNKRDESEGHFYIAAYHAGQLMEMVSTPFKDKFYMELDLAVFKRAETGLYEIMAGDISVENIYLVEALAEMYLMLIDKGIITVGQ